MIENVKYCKEGSRNYMVLLCNYAKENDYQIKMMERKQLEYFFPCKIRHMNGNVLYYYDITSKVSIANYHQGREWGRDQICTLIKEYYEASSELANFLLDESKIVLHPEYIYYDYETKHHCFLFYPDHIAKDNIYEELFEYWLEHVNHKDSELTDWVYQMYEEAENGGLSVSRLKHQVDLLQDDSQGERKEQEVSMDISSVGDMPNSSLIDPSFPEIDMKIENEKEHIVNRRKIVLWIVFFIAMLVEVGDILVLLLFRCTNQEKLILFSIGVVFVFFIIGDIVLLVKEWSFEKRKKSYDKALREYRDTDYMPLQAPTPPQVQMSDFMYARGEKEETKNPNSTGDETVFFDSNSQYEYKLYAMDRRNKVHISLLSLPCTIGKAKELVDYCISDASVSRMHAKLETIQGKYYLVDLNSTNGTFVNGMPLSPNAKIEIEPGDEIRFGKMRYSFR